MRKAAQRGLHPADEHRHAGVGLVDAVAVHRDRAVGAQAGTSAGSVYVGISALAGHGIVVDHAVNHTGGDQKAEPWSSKALERLRAAVFRQTEYGHTVSRRLQHPADDGVPEGGMVHICLAYDVDKIRRVPAQLGNLLRCDGQKRAWHRGAPPMIEMRPL